MILRSKKQCRDAPAEQQSPLDRRAREDVKLHQVKLVHNAYTSVTFTELRGRASCRGAWYKEARFKLDAIEADMGHN